MARVNDKWIMFLVRIEGPTYHEFHRMVDENGQTKAKVIRLLVKRYLDEESRKPRIGRRA